MLLQYAKKKCKFCKLFPNVYPVRIQDCSYLEGILSEDDLKSKKGGCYEIS